jgi:LysM repeat protein
MKQKAIFLVSLLLFVGCNSDNIRTHSSHPKSRQQKDTTATHSRSLNSPEKEQPELESEVKYSAIKTELTVSIPQTIFKNLRLEVVAESPQILEEVTTFINNNLENLRYIASDEDLKSELDRLLREKFNGEATITVKGNRVIQPIDSTKVTKPTPKPVIEDTRKFHTVQQGEGYLSIARKYGVNVNSLYKLNPGKKTLTKGDKIRIK